MSSKKRWGSRAGGRRRALRQKKKTRQGGDTTLRIDPNTSAKKEQGKGEG